MQVASSTAAISPSTPQNPTAGEIRPPMAANSDPRLAQYKVIRRNGAVVAFEPSKIAIAVTKAFLAVNGGQSAGSARVRELYIPLTEEKVLEDFLGGAGDRGLHYKSATPRADADVQEQPWDSNEGT